MGRLFAYLKLYSGQSDKLTKLFYGFSDQVFSVGAVFLANIVLARTTTESDYGSFVLIYSVFTFLSGIHNALLLEPYTVFATGKYRAQFADYLQLALRINLATGLLLALFVLLVTGGVVLYDPSLFSPATLGLAGGILFLLTGAFFRRVFYAELDSTSAAQMSLFYFFVVCLGLAGLFYAGSLSGFSVFLVLAVGWIAASPIFFRRHRPRAGTRRFLSDHPGYWRDHWRYSRWVLATALVFQLINQGYYWIVGGLLTVEDVAKLKAAQNIILPINLIFTSVSLFLLPRMSIVFQQHSAHGLNVVVKKVTLLTLGVAITFFVLVLLFGKELLDLIYAGKYTSTVYLLYIIGLTPIALGVGNVFNDALKAMEQPKWVFYAYIAGGGITLTLGVAMVLHFGLVGAAWGMVVSTLAYAAPLAYRLFLVSR